MHTLDSSYELGDQLSWHWQQQLRSRLAGLSDDEYFWEPVPDCWSVRPRGTSHAPVQAGSGAFTIEFAFPAPDPPPVTTIAWRLGHIIVGVFGARIGSHFGGRPVDYQSFDYAGTAAEALDQLDEMYDLWVRGVASLTDDALARPCGPSEGPFADRSMAALVLHVNREVIHHGAEIALLRDLYLRKAAVTSDAEAEVEP
ncbi:DinB family protein [Rhodococcus oxybenzonivorans]|uniref:DinB family protein n=1 Tax=Rhodococcus oxybenzonivorans TaxID=1990687 RepID=UPI002952BC25|nr:DinB family protein [Rhodococcus oxybenzonivorans]MDV7356040.1 DinB family protein [Rhodococcus oxybenzonivorans]